MMWRLKHRLFGWHYVHMSNPDHYDIIRRLRHTPSGVPYVVHREENIIFLNDIHRWKVTELTRPEVKT